MTAGRKDNRITSWGERMAIRIKGIFGAQVKVKDLGEPDASYSVSPDGSISVDPRKLVKSEEMQRDLRAVAAIRTHQAKKKK